ncbi:MAG: hypothetical protein DRP35_06100 [Candidatus Zixiibacteriota bacterium]|nr:MAG: hypothetical protein DRP35_06100 [candidate division Zixibacteria bacterium]
MKKLIRNSGFTIIELLLSLLITGIISTAGLQLYIRLHNQTFAQENISDMQQNCRATLYEIENNLRMAGFKVGNHDAYDINGDTLYIFSQINNPIDTIIYYLQTSTESGNLELPSNIQAKYLMKKTNSDNPIIYSSFIRDITYSVINSNTIGIDLEIRTEFPDKDYNENEGYRIYAASESVTLRNLAFQ